MNYYDKNPSRSILKAVGTFDAILTFVGIGTTVIALLVTALFVTFGKAGQDLVNNPDATSDASVQAAQSVAGILSSVFGTVFAVMFGIITALAAIFAAVWLAGTIVSFRTSSKNAGDAKDKVTGLCVVGGFQTVYVLVIIAIFIYGLVKNSAEQTSSDAGLIAGGIVFMLLFTLSGILKFVAARKISKAQIDSEIPPAPSAPAFYH